MVNDIEMSEDNQIQSSPLSSSPAPECNAEQLQQQQQQQQQQDMMVKGKFCAVYEGTAPPGCKFKFFNGPGRSNPESVILADKLNSIKSDTEKNPVAKLNEMMLMLKKKNVRYEMIDIGGFIHSPIYTIRAQNEDISVFGTGSSKKEAKRAAAIAFIERMDFNNESDKITSTTSNNNNNSNEKKIADQVLDDIKSEINPIGLLQEVCMNYHWKLPIYDYTTADLALKRGNIGFKASCSLYMYKTNSVQRTKQSAKREAARLMYEKIKKFSADHISSLSLDKFPIPSSVLFQNNRPGKKNNELDLINSPENMKTIEKFYEKLKMSKNPTVNKVKGLDFTKYPGSAVEILDQIGEEEGFTSTYVLLSKSASSVSGILMQVSITPFIIHLGTGKSLSEAQEAAANVALVYLKLFLESTILQILDLPANCKVGGDNKYTGWDKYDSTLSSNEAEDSDLDKDYVPRGDVNSADSDLLKPSTSKKVRLKDNRLNQEDKDNLTTEYDSHLTESKRRYNLKSEDYNSVYCMMWDESKAGRGGEEISSAIFKWADNVILNSAGVNKITLWSDNCFGQNKNISIIMCFFWIMQKYPQIERINMKYLLKGHTHMEADTVHA
ncbi:Double-stranded RNA-binding domain [Cinara cedri]|uniref:Double-stranded RNA-binding domain n=1 Tax=Cinara cedri TaxID=506608 RepID=A0A5E4NDC3_9HEMI|nr:Double-stranded RNA-binding domain [Cinara cedri]